MSLPAFYFNLIEHRRHSRAEYGGAGVSGEESSVLNCAITALKKKGCAVLCRNLLTCLFLATAFASAGRAMALSAAPLSAQKEQALKPKDTFQECDKCPKMIVVPAGTFTMGWAEGGQTESPEHTVTIGDQFAVGQYEVTFDQWDACVADGGCNGYKPSDQGWGRGTRPVINVNWNDAKAYVAWIAKKTQKPYRLLSEAKYEYAMRAGTTTAFLWGNALGTNNANCGGCGSRWDRKGTAPVGSFAPNRFGLYDMAGNAWAWTEDCFHDSYRGAPTDGSAWTSGDCTYRVMRGGAWGYYWVNVRSAMRLRVIPGFRDDHTGFRVGRTLLAP